MAQYHNKRLWKVRKLKEHGCKYCEWKGKACEDCEVERPLVERQIRIEEVMNEKQS
jgi:hypothetical protein